MSIIIISRAYYVVTSSLEYDYAYKALHWLFVFIASR